MKFGLLKNCVFCLLAFVAVLLLQRQSCFAAALDGKVEIDGLFHDQGDLFCSTNEPSSKTPVKIRFRCLRHDAGKVDLLCSSGKNARPAIIPLKKVDDLAAKDSRYEYWQTVLAADKSIRRYRFRVEDGSDTVWYNARGASAAEAKDADFFLIPDFKVPQWLKDGVIYQIFPDRFFNGDPKNDVKEGEYVYGKDRPVVKKWGESPVPEHGESPSFIFFGGDLQGVLAKLCYIRETLGANIVYLNPVFKAPSNHKYDTCDYMHVDPHFGTDGTLQELSEALHCVVDGKRGYLLLDGVFNHTGDGHAWFGKYSYLPDANTPPGAYRSKNSPFYSYYTFSQWPDKYATFLDVASLPKLDFASQKVKDAIYGKPDAIALHYLKAPFKIDGWRIDAPQYADLNGKQGSDPANYEIWREFRRAIKKQSPDAAILGENWGDVSPWVSGGDQWDCATNFEGFTQPVSEWITGFNYDSKPSVLSVSQFDQKLRSTRSKYPTNVQQAMSNHLCNHDISRFGERAGGDIKKTELALLFQMTYIGAPTLYYGDEYGMRGKGDPEDRKTFDWAKVERGDATIEFASKLIALRNKFPALRSGSFITMDVKDEHGIYAFGRCDAKNKIAVVLNKDRSEHALQLSVFKLDLPEKGKCIDAISGKSYEMVDGMVSLVLPAQSGMILVF